MFLDQHNAKRNNILSLSSLSRLSLFLAVVLCISFSHASAADLVFSPNTATVEKGNTISVSVYVSNNTQSINAVSGSIAFPSDLLTLKSISKDGSIIKLWAEEPSYSNADGTAKFEGVILNPGFSDPRGKVLTFSFLAKQAGTANISFKKGEVLANDGNATSVVGSLGTGSYVITISDAAPAKTEQASPSNTGAQSPTIVSSTHPNEEGWYNTRDASFSWDLPKGVIAVRTLYDEKPLSTPSKVYDPPISKKSFTTDTDGTFYMHVQFKTDAGWGSVAHRKFQIDTAAPTDLQVTPQEGATVTESEPELGIQANDLSGVDHYGVRVDGSAEVVYPASSLNTYKLPHLSAGKHDIDITAYDKAGNKTTLSTSLVVAKLDAPIIVDYTKRTEAGHKVKISGVAFPGKTVEVQLVGDNKSVQSETTKVDSDGTFELVWSDKLSAGVYEMSARITDSSGSTSDWTDSRLIVIENMKLIQIGLFVMNWLSLALIIILAGVLLLAVMWYSWLHFIRFRRGVERTMKEAEDTLKTNVQAFRRDTEEFHTVLSKAQKKRELTKEEVAILKKFKKRLDITEKEIEKKLEQIG